METPATLHAAYIACAPQDDEGAGAAAQICLLCAKAATHRIIAAQCACHPVSSLIIRTADDAPLCEECAQSAANGPCKMTVALM